MNPHPPDISQPQKGLTKRAISGFVWMFSGSMAGAGLQLGVTMILARLLSPADFGLLSAALVIIFFTEVFSSLGMGPALIQRQDLETKHISTAFTVNLLFTISLGVLVFLGASTIAAFYRMPDLIPVLQVLAIVFPIHGILLLSTALLKRAGQFRQLAAINFTSYAVGYALVGVAAAAMGYGVWALVAATIAQATLNSVLLFWSMPYSVRPRFDWSAFKDLMGYGGGFTIAVLANYFARQGDNFVVGRMLGAAALGFYGKAFSLMTLPTRQFSKVMDDVLFPVLSRVQDNQQRLAIAYRRGISTVSLAVLPASCFAIVLAPEVIRVIYGPGWEPAIVPFQILCLGMFFRAAYKISASIIYACGAIYNFAIIQLIYGGLVVGGALMMQRWGLPGVAVSSAFAIGVNYWLLSRTSLRLVNQPWREFGRWHVPGILLSLLMLLILLAVATGLRMMAAPALVTLLISVLVTGVSLLLYLRFLPGEAGFWLRALITKYWRKRSNFKQSFMKALSTR